MLFQFPQLFTTTLQQLTLALNTILLIVILVVAELVYADKPRAERSHLKYLYPVVAVVICLLGFTIYRQAGKK
jgi:hypothetical protein